MDAIVADIKYDETPIAQRNVKHGPAVQPLRA